MNALKDLILRYLEIARDTIKLSLVFFSFWISSFFAARFGSVVRFLFLPFFSRTNQTCLEKWIFRKDVGNIDQVIHSLTLTLRPKILDEIQ